MVLPEALPVMNVSLSPELERLVHEKVESGMYLSANEVLVEALRLLDERDRLRQMRLEELRKEIAIGIEEADRGEVVPLDAEATLAKVRGRKIGTRENT